MNEPLRNFIRAVRRHVQRAVVAYGVSVAVCAVLWSSSAWLLLDWLVRFSDPALRFAGTALVLGVSVCVAWRWLVQPLLWFPDDLAVARAVERRIPSLRERLVAAVQFALMPQEAGAGAAAWGSPALRELTVRRAVELLAPHRPEEIIDRSRVARWIAAAALSVAAAVAVVAVQPRLAGIGLKRLLAPWSDTRWPRRTELVLRDATGRDLKTLPQPLVWAVGERRELTVENARGALPEDVVIEFLLADGSVERRRPRPTVVFAPPARSLRAPERQPARSDARGTVHDSGGDASASGRTVPDASAQSGSPADVAAGHAEATRLPVGGERREVGVLLASVAEDWRAVRAIGGDDREGPWLTVRPEPPPEIRRVRLTVRPPGYVQAGEKVLPEGTLAAEVLVGGVVRVEAEASKPVRVARLVAGNRVVAATVDESGRRLTASWRIESVGTEDVAIDLRDAFGLRPVVPTRLRIVGRADRAPEVHLLRPQTDLSVTPQAVVPVQIEARDDLALREVRLAYSIDRREPADTTRREDQPPPTADRATAFAQRHVLHQWAAPEATAHRAELNWELAALRLQPGDRIVFRGEADDFCDLGTDHTGVSVARTLTVVTPREKFDELVELHRILSNALGDAAEQQRSIRQRTEQLSIQADRTGTLRPQDLDVLKQLETEQRELAARTIGEQDSLLALTERILQAARNNRLQERRLIEELEHVRDRLNETQRLFPDAAGALTLARKSAQEQSVADAAEALQRARGGQDEIERLLRGLTERLGQQQSELQFEGALSQLLHEQADVRDQTAAVGRRTLGRPVDALDAQGRADLEKLQRQQRGLAERLSRLLDSQTASSAARHAGGEKTERESGSRTPDSQAAGGASSASGSPASDAAASGDGNQAAGAPRERNNEEGRPTSGDTGGFDRQRSQSLARRLRESAVVARMERTAEAIANNDVLDAVRRQEEILRDLQDALDAADRERRRGPQQREREELIKRARQSEESLQRLRRQQRVLQDRTAALRDLAAGERRRQAGSLAEEQAELQRRLRDELQRLRKLRNDAARAAGERAERSMADAADRLQADDAAAATMRQAEAAELLRRAADAVARQRRQLEQQLAWEQATRLADWLEGLIARQRRLRDELDELQRQHAESGRWRRSDLRRLRELEQTQAVIRGDVERVRETVPMELFRVVLDGAGDNMGRVVADLQRRQLSERTVEAAELAARRLQALQHALQPPQTAKPAGDENAGEQNGGRPGDRVPLTALLQLLADLQAQLRDRTAALEGRRDKLGQLADDDREELDRIAAEQDRLRAIALEWLPEIESLLQAGGGDERREANQPPSAKDVESPSAEKTPDAAEPRGKPTGRGESRPEQDDHARPARPLPAEPSEAGQADASASAVRSFPHVREAAFIAAALAEEGAPRDGAQSKEANRGDAPAEVRGQKGSGPGGRSALDRAVLKELRGEMVDEPARAESPSQPEGGRPDAPPARHSDEEPASRRGGSDVGRQAQETSGRTASGSPAGKAPVVPEIERLRRDWDVAIARLSAGKTDEPTQDAQKDAEQQLKKLLEKLRNLPRNDQANRSPNPQQPSGRDGSRNRSQLRPGSGAAAGHPASTAGGAGTPQTPRQDADRPQDSEQAMREAAERAARLLRRRRLLESIWGHLPPQVRDRILNVQQEKVPPEYADLVQRYYDALAQPKERSR